MTANDRSDKDTGANNLQNFPILTSVSASSTHVAGTLNSVADTTFTLQFFDNQGCNASGFGEGKVFLGETAVTTDGRGNASFAATFATTATGFVAATATNTNDTSEFSQCMQVNTGGGHDVGVAGGGFSTSGRAHPGDVKEIKIKIKIKNFGNHAEDSVPYAVTLSSGPVAMTYSGPCTGDAALLSSDNDLDPGEVVTVVGCTVTYTGGTGDYVHDLTVTHQAVADDKPIQQHRRCDHEGGAIAASRRAGRREAS